MENIKKITICILIISVIMISVSACGNSDEKITYESGSLSEGQSVHEMFDIVEGSMKSGGMQSYGIDNNGLTSSGHLHYVSGAKLTDGGVIAWAGERYIKSDDPDATVFGAMSELANRLG